MKKKRLLAITLVITLFASIFALAGCGKQKEASNNDEITLPHTNYIKLY